MAEPGRSPRLRRPCCGSGSWRLKVRPGTGGDQPPRMANRGAWALRTHPEVGPYLERITAAVGDRVVAAGHYRAAPAPLENKILVRSTQKSQQSLGCDRDRTSRPSR